MGGQIHPRVARARVFYFISLKIEQKTYMRTPFLPPMPPMPPVFLFYLIISYTYNCYSMGGLF